MQAEDHRNAKEMRWDMAKAAQILYPSRYSGAQYPKPAASPSLRFNPLLLDFGEMELQDWAVSSSSTALKDQPVKALRRKGGKSSAVASWNTTGSLLWASTQDRNPSIIMKSIHGRLRLCTKSIIFEPIEVSRAIIKIPLDKVVSSPTLCEQRTDAEKGSHHHSAANSIVITTQKHLLMKENNLVTPFISVDLSTEFRFVFLHSDPRIFLQLVQNIALWKNNGSVSLRDDISSASSRLQMTLRSHVNQHPSFHSGLQQPLHPLNLYPHETETGVNFTCFFMTPLVHTPGCCVLGKEHLYFQPWRGPWDAILSHSSKWTESIGVPPKASFWTVSSIVATARRYHGLRDVALEIFFNTGPSILLAFPTWKDREWVLEHLSEPRLSYTPNGPSQIRPSKIPCHTDVIFMEQALLAWLQGTIDNFQYLLLINSASGRTFHDLSRYPVFPWVIADYASPHLDCGTFFSPFSKAKKDFIVEYKTVFRDLQKPVGALNEQRLEYFQTRYKNMQDMEHAFLYGTHFSAPGYVLYFLVRMMPEHMLCLQNGKFDAPDRLFYSMDHCFSSLLTNPADVKECIPQFFDTTGNGDFLFNACNLPLGVTQNGIRVNDVYLPPWAKSPKDFIWKNRLALESDYCSRHLHYWIDLIFGIRSRGERAIEAMNLFHPTAYLGPKDLEKMNSEEEKQHAELHATEFGIVPDQLFVKPHPHRHIDLLQEQKNDLHSFFSDQSHRLSSREGVEETKESWEVLNKPKSSLNDTTRNRSNKKNLFYVSSTPRPVK